MRQGGARAKLGKCRHQRRSCPLEVLREKVLSKPAGSENVPEITNPTKARHINESAGKKQVDTGAVYEEVTVS